MKMLNPKSNNDDDKIMAVLEYYLSLHEAREIFSMIVKDYYSVEEVQQRLQEFREGEEE